MNFQTYCLLIFFLTAFVWSVGSWEIPLGNTCSSVQIPLMFWGMGALTLLKCVLSESGKIGNFWNLPCVCVLWEDKCESRAGAVGDEFSVTLVF